MNELQAAEALGFLVEIRDLLNAIHSDLLHLFVVVFIIGLCLVTARKP